MRILLVEDDAEVARFVRKGLQEAGHVVEHAGNGRDGLFLAASEQFDILVLDRMLPGGVDGVRLVETLRGQGNRTPVLFLSALSAVDERVKGLKAGGDDYLVKPFAFSELVARIQVLLRRGRPRSAAGEAVLGLADLEVDLLRHKATRAGRRLELTVKEFNLLVLLLRRQGEVLSRTEIAEQVWDMNFDSATNVIDVAIRRLRAKLDAPFERALLHTVRGMGYVLEARDP